MNQFFIKIILEKKTNWNTILYNDKKLPKWSKKTKLLPKENNSGQNYFDDTKLNYRNLFYSK